MKRSILKSGDVVFDIKSGQKMKIFGACNQEFYYCEWFDEDRCLHGGEYCPDELETEDERRARQD